MPAAKRIWFFEVYSPQGEDIHLGTISGAESVDQAERRLLQHFGVTMLEVIQLHEVSRLVPEVFVGCRPIHLHC